MIFHHGIAVVVAGVSLVGCANEDRGASSDRDSISICAAPSANERPIVSSRRLKDDIAYVSVGDLEQLKDQLVKVRLATFRYKQGDKARHLGFIIEDSPDIPASDIGRSQVDLYAYASMAVAAIQVQERQLEQLEADVDALSNEVESLRGRRGFSSANPELSHR